MQVEFDIKEGIALITMDDGKKNAITPDAAAAILAALEEAEASADAIVIASHRPDLSDYLLGSTAARVVRHAQCTVLVLR